MRQRLRSAGRRQSVGGAGRERKRAGECSTQTTIGRRRWKRDGNRPPPRLNDSNASQRGERQTARRLPHGDSCGVNNKLQQLMLCSSKSMSTSLLLIRISLSTSMGGPWGRCRRTFSVSYGRRGTSAVSCARSGGTRMGSAWIPLSTPE